MDKEKEKKILEVDLKIQKKRFNVIRNNLGLIRKKVENMDKLEKMSINENLQNKLIEDLKSCDKKVFEMFKTLEKIPDEDFREEMREKKLELLDELVNS